MTFLPRMYVNRKAQPFFPAKPFANCQTVTVANERLKTNLGAPQIRIESELPS
jgi:hypothetical protein